VRYQSVDDTLHLTVKSQNLTYIVILTPSGVSRVGVTWGGNWWVSPFFLEKNLRTFLASESDWPFLAVISSPLPSSYVVYPVFFINSATKNHFRSGVTPLEGVTRGSPSPAPPPSDANIMVSCSLQLLRYFSLAWQKYSEFEWALQ